jgi:hypothetical protein
MTKNKTIIGFAICIIAFSCNRKMYYNTIQANTHDFDFVLSYIQKNKLLELNDSLELHDKTAIHFDNKCIYEEKIQDSLVVSFMKKYDLTRICFHKDKQNYYDSVITFHKNYNPVLGSSVTINYDFGKSKLRDRIKSGEKLPDLAASIINDKYIYLLKPRPALGE